MSEKARTLDPLTNLFQTMRSRPVSWHDYSTTY